jgi:hypothetical protein
MNDGPPPPEVGIHLITGTNMGSNATRFGLSARNSRVEELFWELPAVHKYEEVVGCAAVRQG